MLKLVPVSLEFMRGIVGVIGIGCAYMTGRSLALVRKGAQKQSRLYGWIFRTVLCMVAVGLRHRLNVSDVVIWSLAAIAVAVAFWQHSRETKEEDLTSTMFPDEEPPPEQRPHE
jgi:hypothetical protein